MRSGRLPVEIRVHVERQTFSVKGSGSLLPVWSKKTRPAQDDCTSIPRWNSPYLSLSLPAPLLISVSSTDSSGRSEGEQNNEGFAEGQDRRGWFSCRCSFLRCSRWWLQAPGLHHWGHPRQRPQPQWPGSLCREARILHHRLRRPQKGYFQTWPSEIRLRTLCQPLLCSDFLHLEIWMLKDGTRS